MSSPVHSPIHRPDLEPYRPSAAPAADGGLLRRLCSAWAWFVVCLAVVSDAWLQLPLTGTIEPASLGWTALAAMSVLLVIYGAAAGELGAAGAALTGLLAVVGRLTGGFHVGILLGLLILTIAALRLRGSADRRGRTWLVSVAASTSALLVLFVFLDWLSTLS